MMIFHSQELPKTGKSNVLETAALERTVQADENDIEAIVEYNFEEYKE